MSNSLDPDQDRHFVGPDLGPNCLQKCSADEKSHCQLEKRVKGTTLYKHVDLLNKKLP